MAAKGKAEFHWEIVGIILCALALWLSGFERRWLGFGPWTKTVPDWYPPSQAEFLMGVALTALPLAFSFSLIRYAGVFNKVLGIVGFLYFYLHVVTLGYLADPTLFIWQYFPRA